MSRENKIFEIYKILMQQRLGAGGAALAAQAVSMMDDLEKAIDYDGKIRERQLALEQNQAVWDVLNLTVRTSNCLRAEDIFTIEELCNKTEIDLLKVPNLGRGSLNEIKEALAKRSLTLK